MNRSAVRIRPPAPQNPLIIVSGFLVRRGRILTCPVTRSARFPCSDRYSVARRYAPRSLRIRPPAPQNPLIVVSGFLVRRGRILTCPVTRSARLPRSDRYSVARRHAPRSLRIRPPAPQNPLIIVSGFLVRHGRIRTCPVTRSARFPRSDRYSVARRHAPRSLRIRHTGSTKH